MKFYYARWIEGQVPVGLPANRRTLFKQRSRASYSVGLRIRTHTVLGRAAWSLIKKAVWLVSKAFFKNSLTEVGFGPEGAKALRFMALFRHATHAPRGYPGHALTHSGFLKQAPGKAPAGFVSAHSTKDCLFRILGRPSRQKPRQPSQPGARDCSTGCLISIRPGRL